MRYALSPADLRDYDEALSQRKLAAEGASSAVTESAPPAPSPVKYKAQKPPPQPGDYKPAFLDNSSLGAQGSSAGLFQDAKERVMPVTR